MFDENQIVQVRWNNTNKEWYESKGYVYTKRYEYFEVKAKDLSPRSDARIKATCDYCGREYNAYYVILMDGRKIVQKDCCHSCTGKKGSETSLRKRAVKYIGMAQDECKKHGYILLTTIDEYTDVKMDVRFDCPKHGVQIMMLDNLIHGHGCWDCSYETRFDNVRHSVEYIKECIESINGNKWLNQNDYKNSTTRNLEILCSCGNIFTTSFSNYYRHNVVTCYSCSCKENSGEEKVRRFLEDREIDFEQEKRFDDCRDIKPLPFDFYLPEYNLCIEFDGQHHFENIRNRNDLEWVQNHDKIKNQYCKDNGINLLRIPYWKGHDIESIVAEKLNL